MARASAKWRQEKTINHPNNLIDLDGNHESHDWLIVELTVTLQLSQVYLFPK